MDKEGKFWFNLWAVIILGTCLITFTSFYFNYKKVVEMAELGYEKVTLVGYHYPQWQKCKEE